MLLFYYDAIFQTLKSELAPGNIGVRVLCPTRWTIHDEALASILFNYEVLMKLWEEAVDIVKDTETIARIRDK